MPTELHIALTTDQLERLLDGDIETEGGVPWCALGDVLAVFCYGNNADSVECWSEAGALLHRTGTIEEMARWVVAQ